MASTVLATFAVLKDHVKLKVTQDAVAIDNIGNFKYGLSKLKKKFYQFSKSIGFICDTVFAIFHGYYE